MTMTHYTDDLAVFGHVMGSATDWGSEVHHSDYEHYVNAHTSTYSSEFRAFLTFDGDLYPRDPYDAALLLAFDTTSGGVTGRNATWMDKHYDWSSSEFRSRVGESINLAVNYLADALHGFWLAAGQPIPEFQMPYVAFVLSITTLLIARHSNRGKQEAVIATGTSLPAANTSPLRLASSRSNLLLED